VDIDFFNGKAELKDIGKYCFFKIIQGLKLPIPSGYKGRKFSME